MPPLPFPHLPTARLGRLYARLACLTLLALLSLALLPPQDTVHAAVPQDTQDGVTVHLPILARPPRPTPPLNAVSAGNSHACALTADGQVYCWGSNDVGQLGDGTRDNRVNPVAVTGLPAGITAISTGYHSTCALTAAGGVWCWGTNGRGNLGDGTTELRVTPVPVSGLANGVTAIAAGDTHTCALRNGGVLCWGLNRYGQVGDGGGGDACGSSPNVCRLTPTPATDLTSGVTAIAAGDSHTCAIRGGILYCWGWNDTGQLGTNDRASRRTPTPVSNLPGGIVDVAAGFGHTCAVTDSGNVWCWGTNFSGEIGDGSTEQRLTPVQVDGNMRAVSAGSYAHTCARTTDDAVHCWGIVSVNDDPFPPQLGPRLTPTAVEGLESNVAAISAGAGFSCVLVNRAARCWGVNTDGQLGDGTTEDRRVPVAVIWN